MITQFLHLFRAYLPHLSAGSVLAVLGFCLLVFALSWLRDGRRHQKPRFWAVSSQTLLLGYICLLLVMLVFGRGIKDVASIHPVPFYSYKRILEHTAGSFEWLCMDLFNIMLFLPLGMFFAALREISGRNTRRTPVFAAALGLLVSAVIEFLQFALRRGTCELDDLLHNTLGALFGALIWLGLCALRAYCLRRRSDH